jgi:CBS domain-containing protein
MKSILVKDLMVPLADYATVSDQATLGEAVAALKQAQQHFDQKRYRHRAVLVLDNTNNVVGKISQTDALKALEPKYRGLGDLQELEGLFGFKGDAVRQMITEHGLWKKPIEDICRKAVNLKVKDIMHTPTEGEYVNEDASFNEAVHQLILGRHQSLLVTRANKIVGILRLTDVFHRVSELMEDCDSLPAY